MATSVSGKRFPHRVVRGTHAEGGKVYHRGQVVQARSNLSKLHNKPGSMRFQPVSPDAEDEESKVVYEGVYHREELMTLKVEDLKSIAQDEEIEVAPNMKKDDLITAILA